MSRLIDADALAKELLYDAELCARALDSHEITDHKELARLQFEKDCKQNCVWYLTEAPTVDAVPVPKDGIGELSDGYHTFNGLYYQRMMLFAALVKTYKDRSWKSKRHSDGELCFGGGWFIVGIDTPHGSFTYHYEDKYFDLFDCIELQNGKKWDGHTEDDVTRLLTLDAVPVVRCGECKHREEKTFWCEKVQDFISNPEWFCADGERKGGDE